ncbi:MAG: hypothetical protein D6738_06365, partial [Acidobacteria bacterium]
MSEATNRPRAATDVIEALAIAWRLTMADFVQLWLLALIPIGVMTVITVAVSVPCLGWLLLLVSLLLVKPQFLAGLYAALVRPVDGRPLDFNDLFAAYRERFVESMVAMLPVYAIWIVFSLVVMAISGVSMFGAQMFRHAANEFGPLGVFSGGAAALATLLSLLFAIGLIALVMFLPLTIWDHRGSGWDAFLAAVRLSMARFGQALGFAALAFVIYALAWIVGLMLLCIGVVVTLPIAAAWVGMATVLLYRGWTGREDAPAIPVPPAPAPAPVAPP